MTSGFPMPGSRHGEEHEREYRKDERLDEPHEELQKQKRQRDDIRHQRADDNEEHLAGEHVPEQPERERDHFSKFRNEFKYPHKGVDGIAQREKFAEVAAKTVGQGPEEVRREDRNDGKAEGKVEIGRRRTKKRDELLVSVFYRVQTQRPDAGQEPHPV